MTLIKLYSYLRAYFLNKDIVVINKENLVIKLGKIVEVRVYHPNLENN